MIYDWDPNKEKWLKKNRGISFHEVLYYIANDGLMDVREHPNKEKYPHQKILILKIDNYIYVVPFVQDKNTLFMKTIIPSRSETKKYLRWKRKH